MFLYSQEQFQNQANFFFSYLLLSHCQSPAKQGLVTLSEPCLASSPAVGRSALPWLGEAPARSLIIVVVGVKLEKKKRDDKRKRKKRKT